MQLSKDDNGKKGEFSIGGILGCSLIAFMMVPAFVVRGFNVTLGGLISVSDRIQHDMDDSLISIKTCRCKHNCRCNAGGNISNSPDRL